MNSSKAGFYGKSFYSLNRESSYYMPSYFTQVALHYNMKPDAPEARQAAQSIDLRTRDDYVRPANLGFGFHLSPGVIFYDPNPAKKSISLDATGNYMKKRWLVQLGAGGHYLEDIGTYEIEYESYDSIGFYNEVTTFEFDKGNPDSIIANHVQRTVFDSVTHTTVMERNNKYFYFTIPLNVGYRLYEKKNFVTYLKGGLTYSILVYKDEPTVDFNATDASVIGIQRQVPARTKHNLQLTAGLQFGLRTSDNFMISLEPYFSQFLNSIYEPQSGWSANKPYVLGLRLGVDFNLK
jgi:hypothetical protein